MPSNKPRSRYDRLREAERPFGWSTPAESWDGSIPKPWRVAHADRALKLCKRASPFYRDIYTDYWSEKRSGERQMLWVGLRDNRDGEAHATRLNGLYDALIDVGCQMEKGTQRGRTSHLYIVDDLGKNILRKGTDMNLRDAAIRLAHANAGLREHILPLVTAASPRDFADKLRKLRTLDDDEVGMWARELRDMYGEVSGQGALYAKELGKYLKVLQNIARSGGPEASNLAKALVGQFRSMPSFKAAGRKTKVSLGTRFGWTMEDTGKDFGPNGPHVYYIEKFTLPQRINKYTGIDAGPFTMRMLRIVPEKHREGMWVVDYYAQYTGWETVLRDRFTSPEAAAKKVQKMYDDGSLAQKYAD